MKFSVILFIFSAISSISCEQFIVTIKETETKCIGQYLSHHSHTVVSVHTKGEPHPFSVSVVGDEGEGKIWKSSLDAKKGIHSTNFNFNPFNSTNYQFCIENQGPYEEQFVFSISQGIEAKNYNETFGKKNWTEVDLKAQKIFDQVRNLRDKFRDLEKENDKKFDVVGDIDFKIFVIGITSVSVIVILGCLQLQIMLKFFKHKKLI